MTAHIKCNACSFSWNTNIKSRFRVCETDKTAKLEYLISYEGNASSSAERVEEDLLCITSAHPIYKEAVNEILKNTNTSWSTIAKLLLEDKLIEPDYAGKTYYIRKLGIEKKPKNMNEVY